MSQQNKNPFTEQIMRCSALQYFPVHPEGVKELRDCLRGVAGSEQIAKRIVDAAIAEGPSCPKPSDLMRIARAIKGADEQLTIPAGCKGCSGTGWKIVSRRRFDRIANLEIECEGSERCDCAKGRYLATKDAERAAGQPA